MTSATPVNEIQKRWALLVGIDRYVDPGFSRLNFCVKDVVALNAILERLGYTIACLHDELDVRNARFPTFSNAEAELTRLCQTVGPHDLLCLRLRRQLLLLGIPGL
ncbi:caspase family protein [Leptolyngbya sp. FACHB-321]|uniref:caspase family protein n=1 Tax=Leptolyngbya sp. FACHB-321 TaxID=2692807 RepID=UPI0016848B25|nr:caspase family protein [Leptolyngbya sp. FACHB-321]MBD2033834.1 caspase family protein [Leptolyngbya sp. FACHB-321]